MSASGIATNRTDLTLPTEVASQILQKVQEDSAVMALAQQIALPGPGLTIPVITADPEAAWVAETGVKPVRNPGLSQKIMQPYKLAVIVPFSMEFRRDAATLYNALVSRLPRALAAKFDATVFHGDAPGSNFDVLKNCTKQSLTASPYAGLIAADMDIAEHGGILNGFAMSPQGRGILLAATDKNDRPLFINSVAEGAIPLILGQPVYSCKAAYADKSPEDVIGVAGDWTQAMYGIVQGVTIDISEQASLAAKDRSNNDITINLWQRNMFAVRAEIEVGFVADTNCFNLLTGSPVGATGST